MRTKALSPELLRKLEDWGGFKPGDRIKVTTKNVALVFEKK